MTSRTVLGWLAAGGAALVLVTTLGACTSSGGGASSSNGGAGAAALAPDKAVSGGEVAGGGGSTGDKSAPEASVAGLDLSTAKIRIATMSVQVRRGQSVAAKADQAETIATAVGGDVDSDDREAGKYPTATLLLRIPPADLTNVLGQLSRLGVEKSRELSTRDVTSKVADVTSRVASAKDAIERLRVLYAQAHKVSDVIAIESELNDRESNLESLQAQARALAAETSTAAVTLTLTSAPHKAAPVPPKKPGRGGFVGGLMNGWHAFTATMSGVAAFFGAVLPFVLVLAVLALLGRLTWLRLRPRRSSPAPPDPA